MDGYSSFCPNGVLRFSVAFLFRNANEAVCLRAIGVADREGGEPHIGAFAVEERSVTDHIGSVRSFALDSGHREGGGRISGSLQERKNVEADISVSGKKDANMSVLLRRTSFS